MKRAFWVSIVAACLAACSGGGGVPGTSASATPGASASATPSANPSVTPSANPSATPSAKPTATPTPSPTPTPTATPTAAAGTFWVYDDGTFDWPGDYSYPNPGTNIFIDYADTSGVPLSGAADISVTQVDGAFGAWQPYATNDNFSTVGYTSLTFALKPTNANAKWSCQFLYVGDVPVGISLNVTNYGPAPVPGRWATYTIPLSALGVANANIYKFAIQDQSGLQNNLWYVDNVGFTP